ncbi:MAG: hypothetical protein OXJ90_01835 [Spirochaetaceae bacterium]|nr:hypothetical protein [Spirochaetaceae bacterium]
MHGAKEKPRESLWSVSAARLPYYLVVYAVMVGVVAVMAMAAAAGTLREAIFSAAPRIAAAGAAAVTILTCLEGLVMGATKLLFERARTEGREQGLQEGRAEGRQEGRQEGREQGRQEVTDRWKAWYEENKARQPLPPPPPDPEHNGTN